MITAAIMYTDPTIIAIMFTENFKTLSSSGFDITTSIDDTANGIIIDATMRLISVACTWMRAVPKVSRTKTPAITVALICNITSLADCSGYILSGAEDTTRYLYKWRWFPWTKL